MAGVQVHHPELRNQTLVFEMPDVPYPDGPFACPVCETWHTHKAVHLRYDAVGDVTVCEESWDRIEPHLKKKVKARRRVNTPEPMVLGMGDGRREVFQVVRLED